MVIERRADPADPTSAFNAYPNSFSRAYPQSHPPAGVDLTLAGKPEIPCITTKNAYNSASLRSDRGDFDLQKPERLK
jgi:hypothetical protein